MVTSRPVVLQVGGIALLGPILKDEGAKKQRGRWGGKITQRGENVQPLFDHCVNFSSLLL